MTVSLVCTMLHGYLAWILIGIPQHANCIQLTFCKPKILDCCANFNLFVNFPSDCIAISGILRCLCEVVFKKNLVKPPKILKAKIMSIYFDF